MSKTVKSVMTVMMIGLAVMLGAEAEAHWIVLKGKCYWHSFECSREDKDPGPIDPPPFVELVATPIAAEVLCGPGDIRPIDLSGTPILATRRTPISPRNITQRRAGASVISRNVEWQRYVSDALFLEDTNPCLGLSPIEVIVRKWSSVQMNLYLNSGQSIPHSAWRAGTCTLPDQFNLTNYPENLPPSGTPYVCPETEIKTCHGNC